MVGAASASAAASNAAFAGLRVNEERAFPVPLKTPLHSYPYGVFLLIIGRKGVKMKSNGSRSDVISGAAFLQA